MNSVAILPDHKMNEWDNFVHSHAFGTIYHTSGWRDVIEKAYGHKPLYLAILNENGDIEAGLPLFLVKSRIFGNRLTCLPLAQECNPLVTNQKQYDLLLEFALSLRNSNKAKYIEIKTSESFKLDTLRFGSSINGYCLHMLPLTEPLDDIRKSFHHSCIQRSINKAYKLGVEMVVADSANDIKTLYSLYIKMRKVNGLLPKPYKFFKTIWEIMVQRGHIEVLHALYENRIISSILLLKYKDTVIYEYGATLPGSNQLCTSHFLLWEAIKRSKLQGYKKFDFGRTSNDNNGLIQFKSRWGTTSQQLTYCYVPEISGNSMLRQKNLAKEIMHYSIKGIPQQACQLLGSLCYKYFV